MIGKAKFAVRSLSSPPRWQVKIFYKSGTVETVEIEEMIEMQQLAERGAPWSELDRFEIRYQPRGS